MAVSRRLRFEILRRDQYTCRYCGAGAPDVQLTVDHVVPVALGGGDEPSNLVAACADCNTGKTSVAPDGEVVEDVAADALRWARAMELAAEQRALERSVLDDLLRQFDEAWRYWGSEIDGEWIVPERPTNWPDSVERFLAGGLTLTDLVRLIEIAMSKPGLWNKKVWRYFCGCAWRRVTETQEIARQIIESGQLD